MNKYYIFNDNNEITHIESHTLKPNNGILVGDDNFIKPIINGEEVLEGATLEEIEAIRQQEYLDVYKKINVKVDELITSALARVTGKVGKGLTRQELENLKSEYKDVYLVAKEYVLNQVVIDDVIFQSLEFEEQNDFGGDALIQTANYLNVETENKTRIMIYCEIVCKKYEYGEGMYALFRGYTRKFRSKMITLLDQEQYEKINTGFAMIEELHSKTNEEIQLLFNQFNQL